MYKWDVSITCEYLCARTKRFVHVRENIRTHETRARGLREPDAGLFFTTVSVQVTIGKVMNEENITPGMYRGDVIFMIARLSAHCCNGRDIFI